MITTITASVASIASSDVQGSIVILPILALIALLIQKEVTSGLSGPRAGQMGRVLDIAIVPLLGVCAVTVILGVRVLLQ